MSSSGSSTGTTSPPEIPIDSSTKTTAEVHPHYTSLWNCIFKYLKAQSIVREDLLDGYIVFEVMQVSYAGLDEMIRAMIGTLLKDGLVQEVNGGANVKEESLQQLMRLWADSIVESVQERCNQVQK